MEKKDLTDDIGLFQLMTLDDIGKARSAFAVLFRKYRKWLLGFLISTIKRREDCEEIANDLMLTLWERRKDLVYIVKDAGVKGLLRVLAKRKIVDFYRRKIPKSVVLEVDDNGCLAGAAENAAVNVGYENDQLVILESINRVLKREKVNEVDQQIFWDAFNNVPVKEISERSKYKEKTVYWKLKAMRKMLFKNIGPLLKSYSFGINID